LPPPSVLSVSVRQPAKAFWWPPLVVVMVVLEILVVGRMLGWLLGWMILNWRSCGLLVLSVLPHQTSSVVWGAQISSVGRLRLVNGGELLKTKRGLCPLCPLGLLCALYHPSATHLLYHHPSITQLFHLQHYLRATLTKTSLSPRSPVVGSVVVVTTGAILA
jgi:hypothetical protein